MLSIQQLVTYSSLMCCAAELGGRAPLVSTYAVYLLGNSDVNEALKIKSSIYHRFALCFGLSVGGVVLNFSTK